MRNVGKLHGDAWGLSVPGGCSHRYPPKWDVSPTKTTLRDGYFSPGNDFRSLKIANSYASTAGTAVIPCVGWPVAVIVIGRVPVRCRGSKSALPAGLVSTIRRAIRGSLSHSSLHGLCAGSIIGPPGGEMPHFTEDHDHSRRPNWWSDEMVHKSQHHTARELGVCH
jgi:hypothetical protein